MAHEPAFRRIREAKAGGNFPKLTDIVQKGSSKDEIKVHPTDGLAHAKSQAGHTNRMMQQTADVRMMKPHSCRIPKKPFIPLPRKHLLDQTLKRFILDAPDEGLKFHFQGLKVDGFIK